MCNHGGRVVIEPRQTQVLAGGGFVICEPDLIGAPISGCPVKTTAVTSPCLAVVEILPGSTAPTVMVVGRAAYLATLRGITNGRPPGTIVVDSAGQFVVEAL
jgi:hypothetical protein